MKYDNSYFHIGIYASVYRQSFWSVLFNHVNPCSINLQQLKTMWQKEKLLIKINLSLLLLRFQKLSASGIGLEWLTWNWYVMNNIMWEWFCLYSIGWFIDVLHHFNRNLAITRSHCPCSLQCLVYNLYCIITPKINAFPHTTNLQQMALKQSR